MASKTQNYNLIKPDADDFYNIDDFNKNADIIDRELNERYTKDEINYALKNKADSIHNHDSAYYTKEEVDDKVEKLDKKLIANLLNPTLPTTAKNDIVCINNGDGTYILNGTTSQGISLQIVKDMTGEEFKKMCNNTLPVKVIDTRNDNICHFMITYRNHSSDAVIYKTYACNSVIDTFPDKKEDIVSIEFWINPGQLDNELHSPMLTTNLDATYDDFVAYTGSTGRLNSDVAELRSKSVKKDEVTKNVKVDGKTIFLNSNGALSSKGGGATIIPKPTVNPAIKSDNAKVVITWQDPTDVVYDGAVFSKWKGTKLIVKESGYPTSPDDGTLLVDCTERDKYKNNGYEVADLVNDKVYYFALFPYSTDGVYNYDSGNRLLGEPCALKIVTFADGTDDEIAAMIQAHYDNKINIADYWAVGDKRKVNLSAMSATGVGESHRAQTVEMAIADFEHDNLATAINGHIKAAITLTQVDCLMDASNASNPVNGSSNSENGYMNSSSTNSGGWTNCARRTWCNNVYFNALPFTLRNTVKAVNKKTSAGSQSSTINTTTDKVFLLSESEIYGSTTYSKSDEGSQYEYYKTTANRYKMPKWSSSSSSHIYWQRSSDSGSSSNFCSVYYGGRADYNSASSTLGCAPCLCI